MSSIPTWGWAVLVLSSGACVAAWMLDVRQRHIRAQIAELNGRQKAIYQRLDMLNRRLP